MPLTWVLLLLLVSFWKTAHKIRKQLVISAFAILLVFSNPYLINQAMKWWEMPPVSFNLVEQSDIGIVLTGITNLKKYPQDRTYFNKGADRIYHAVMLYKMKKINKILITGGNISFSDNGISEAETLKEYLLFSGVVDSDIILESSAKNTHQNATFTKQLLEEMKLENKKLILITSAYHINRAKRCFDKVGVKTTPFPTDYCSTDENNWGMLAPSIKALSFSGTLLHELFGMVTYKLLGYI